jgi:hypothetical protein
VPKAKKVGWQSPENSAGEWLGFNESGIEHFNGDPYSAIAREVTQNTNDARLDGRPAFLRFAYVEITPAQFPDVDEFKSILVKCAAAAKSESAKAEKFFDVALDLISKPKIPVLAISDRNTTGMEGPCKIGTPYHAFMKSTGISKKTEANAGGSFGIGKNAPFALSDLRTVFVATTYMDGSKPTQLIQGKSVLMSHQDKGRLFTNSAYWGFKEKFEPVNDSTDDLPAWLPREMDATDPTKYLGTSIYVPGFKYRKDWDKIIAAYIVQNFFKAISDNTLVVEVGSYHIDSKTIDDIFDDREIVESIEDFPNQPEAFTYSKYFHQCMRSTETIHETSQQLHLGKVGMGILLGEEFPKRIAFIRNGMLITDSLSRLERFPGLKNFVAVIECQNKKGNELLRLMEPPRHDTFEPERLGSRQEVNKGKLALKQLAEFARTHLDKHARNPIEEQINLTELNDLLGAEVTGKDPALDGEPDPNGLIKISSRQRPKRSGVRRSEFSEKGLGLGFENLGSGGDLSDDKDEDVQTPHGAKPSSNGNLNGIGTGQQPSGGENGGTSKGGESNQTGEVSMSLMGLKGFPLSNDTRRLSFIAPAEGKLRLSFERVGADANSPLKAKSTTAGTLLEDGRIEIQVEKLVKQKIDVSFTEDFTGAVKVVANAI